MAVVNELKVRNAELEQALRSAQRPSESTSAHLASVSHEIRTPLNVILGLAELLARASGDPLQLDYMDTIKSSAHSLLRLMNGLLDPARVESGPMQLELTRVDINTVLNNIHSLFAPGAYARGIEFHTSLVAQRYARVVTDPLRLRQILINLADNAVKFTRSGHVLMSAQVMQSTDRRCRVRFTVQDTGAGIPHKTQATMFRVSVPADIGYHNKIPRSGLGLQIVTQIVMLMQGEVAVHSEPGKGSSFFVTLPLTLDEPPAHRPVGEQLPALLVPDYPALSHHQRRFLERAGLILVERPQQRPGVVLVELAAATLRARKRSPPCKAADRGDWPRIAYCSSWDPAIVQHLEQADYAGVIVKTSCPRRFRARLDNILGDNRAAVRRHASARLPPRALGVRKRLLVLDDHAVNLKLMQRYCTELGVGVDCESSPARALRLMRKRKYHLIFLDIHMPEIDGHEFARQVRSGTGQNRDTPIVALTADATQERAKLIESGMHELLVKPVSPETFRATVRRWRRRPVRTMSRVAELRQVLRQRLPGDRAALVSLERGRDYSQLVLAAHKLYGASLYCELPKLSLAVRRLEDAARTAEPAMVRDALAEALTAIDESLSPQRPV
ncbi:MAG: ATP-binding protein [Gammaproteobacteria bacterium]|nr:ATP-binding protein [Gammaproteobacteria bacterium]